MRTGKFSASCEDLSGHLSSVKVTGIERSMASLNASEK
jgi:hypothetical protein